MSEETGDAESIGARVPVTTWLAIAPIPVLMLLVGSMLKSVSRIYDRFWEGMGSPVNPRLTEAALQFHGWVFSVLLLLLIGLAMLALLIWAAQTDRARPHLPLLITIAWMVPVMLLVSGTMAFLLPLMHMLPN